MRIKSIPILRKAEKQPNVKRETENQVQNKGLRIIRKTMSDTNKHRIEGLYHHGIIPLKDVPRSVVNGWDRQLYKGAEHRTSGYEKRSRIDQERTISDLEDSPILNNTEK